MHNAYKAAERQWGRALGRDAGRIRGRPGEHGVLARGTAGPGRGGHGLGSSGAAAGGLGAHGPELGRGGAGGGGGRQQTG